MGETILLIHGFPTASWDWHRLWLPLSERFRLIACDMLGFGFSDKPREHNYSVIEQADLQEAFVKQMRVREVHLLVHDYGVSVAQELLARQLENRLSFQIKTVCFLNGGLFPEQHRARLVQRLLNSPLGPLLSKRFRFAHLTKSFMEIFGQNKPSEEELLDFWRLIAYQGGHRILHLLIHYINDRRRFRDRWLEALQKSTVPMLLINGVDDPVSGGHMADHYEKVVPHPHVVRLAGVGHYPQVEAPEAVLKNYYTLFEPHENNV